MDLNKHLNSGMINSTMLCLMMVFHIVKMIIVFTQDLKIVIM